KPPSLGLSYSIRRQCRSDGVFFWHWEIRDERQIRGLLKNLGLVVGRAKFNIFGVRTEELIEDRAELAAVIRPLLAARKAIEEQICDLDRKVLKLARHDMQVRSFMTLPGVGPVTALCFKAIEKCGRLPRIDDPAPCLRRGRLVGPNLEVR